MEIVGNELVVALEGLVGDVEVDGALLRFRARADEVDSALVAFEERRQEGGDEGLLEDLEERHAGEERDEPRDEGWVVGGFDDEGELHRGRGHFDGELRGFVEGAVDDVGPVDELGDGGGVEAELGGRDVGDEAGAGDVVGIVEAVALVAAVGDAVDVVLVIVGSEEGAEVVIEPPGDFGRWGILEVDDGVLVAGKVGFVEEGAGAVDEAAEFVGGVGADALMVKAAEEGGRAGTVKTLVVIEDPNVQNAAAPRKPPAAERRSGIS